MGRLTPSPVWKAAVSVQTAPADREVHEKSCSCPKSSFRCCGKNGLLRCPEFRRGIKAAEILTAATRSPRCIRHRRRSDRSPLLLRRANGAKQNARPKMTVRSTLISASEMAKPVGSGA